MDGVHAVLRNPEHCARVMPALEAMASKVLNLWPDPGRTAACKLIGNLGLLSMPAVAGEVMRLAAACGIPAAEAAGLFQVFNPGDVLPERVLKVAAGPSAPPSATVAMMRKDLRLIPSETEQKSIAMALLPPMNDLFSAAIIRGAGALDAPPLVASRSHRRSETAAFNYTKRG